MVYIAEVFVLVGVGLAILAYPDVLIVHAQRLLAGRGQRHTAASQSGVTP